MVATFGRMDHVTQSLPPAVQLIAEVDVHGGTGRYVLQLLDFYQSHGVRATVSFVNDLPEESFINAVRSRGVVLGNVLGSWCPAQTRAVWPRQFLRDRADLGVVADRLKGIPTVFSVATPDVLVALASQLKHSLYLVHSYPTRKTNFLEDSSRRYTGRWLLTKDFHPVTVSNFAAKELADYWGISQARVSVVHHQVAQVPEQDGTANIPLRIGTLGHVVAYKGIDVWLDIADRLASRLRQLNARMTWWGEGRQLDWAREAIRRRGLTDVAELPGFTGDPIAALADCTIYLQPSRLESAGFAILEAMSMGLPVVATDAGGIPDLLGGFAELPLHAIDDVAAMAATIDRLLTDSHIRNLASHQLQARARENFSHDAWDAAWARLHSSLT